ncbi:ABC transporter ATP-binding protein [Pseudonocardia sp. GCM10023141]|uniref:ABC transporter ATP-binding protein n=1 Tax=Pseudonocardia sp. GCM10023141 TaxID=3252653 RepID=UPI00361FAF7E
MSLLSIKNIDVHHGLLKAISDFSVEVDSGSMVAVIGANGAGKSTLMRAVAGVLPVTTGSIEIAGEDVTKLPAHARVHSGIALVPEGRRLFRSLSLEENLLTGAYRARPGPWNLDAVYDLFPWMPERRDQSSRLLSGGEQQAVAIGRALMSNPRVLLIDELSLGLAPIVVKQIYASLLEIVANGCAVLFVEQDVTQALAIADDALCLLEGRTVLAGTPAELNRHDVETAYFGTAAAAPGRQ